MAKSIVELTVEDGGFNQKLKNAAGAMKRFGDSLANAAANGLSQFAQGLKTARQAQQALNDTVKANLYVLAATAIAEAGKALYDWASGAYEAEKAQKKLNAEIESTKLAIDNMTSDLNFDVRIAQASGKSVDEILKIRKAAAQARLELADANYDKITALGSKATKEQIAEATSMQEAAWKNMRKVLEDMTINDIQKRNATGPYKPKTPGGSYSASRPSSIDYAPDSIAAQQALVAELTKKWQNAGAAVRDGYKKELEAAQRTLANMIEGRNFLTADTSIMKSGQLFTLPTENLNNVVGEIKLTSPLEKMNEELKKLREELERPLDTSGYQEALQKVINKENEIKKFKGEDLVDAAESNAKAWKSASSAISSVGSALSGLENPAAKVTGIVAEAIATIAQTFAASLKGTFTPWDWIAGAAAGTATMIATISSIKSATKFADGGVVRGNTYSGDQIPAFLNAGEVVLNRAQQVNLASQLDGGALNNIQLEATITGEQIHLATRNYGRRTGRGEYVRTKSR